MILAAVLAAGGCSNVNGPFAARTPQRVDDPRLPIAEQEMRSRDRLALPLDVPDAMPRSYTPSGDQRGR
jgi:hypothetical protein